jgi:hypothetical protein
MSVDSVVGSALAPLLVGLSKGSEVVGGPAEVVLLTGCWVTSAGGVVAVGGLVGSVCDSGSSRSVADGVVCSLGYGLFPNGHIGKIGISLVDSTIGNVPAVS